MTNKDAFSARLDRLKQETDGKLPDHGKSPVPEAPAPLPRKTGIAWRTMVLPIVSLSVLAVGALAFYAVLPAGPSKTFDLKTAILTQMSEEDKARLGKDPEIERALQERKFPDPDLARLILSH